MPSKDSLKDAVKTNPAGSERQAKTDADRRPEPGLYVVATPIGNLDDITIRALDILAGVDRLYAEDTRTTHILLRRHGLERSLSSYHDHNGSRVRPAIMEQLAEDLSVALVCDAGAPCVSDPGFALVRDAHAAGIKVTPIPGASAVVTALTASGLPSDRFLFGGFLPRRRGARRNALRELASTPATLIFFEAPTRLAESLADMTEIFGGREAVMAREMTKRFEEIVKMPLPQLLERVQNNAPRGEVTLLIAPDAQDRRCSEQRLIRLIRSADKSRPLKEQAGVIADLSGWSRRDIYSRLLTGREARRRHYRLGVLAEYVACAMLICKGYHICALRAKTPVGEIDIVARKRDVLVFAEVKSRRNIDAALEAVTPKTQRRIADAAELWVAKHRSFAEYGRRFDIIAMRGAIPAQHVRDAWRPSGQ